MAEESFQEKTERATPRKRLKAREEGQVARSTELPAVFVLLAAVLFLRLTGRLFGAQLLALMQMIFTFSTIPQFSPSFCIGLLHQVAGRFLAMVTPVLGILLLTGLAVNFFQVGFHLSGKAVMPKFSRFNVFKGIKRLFSLKSFVEMVKSIFKLAIVGYISYRVIKGESAHFLELCHLDAAEIMVYILKGAFKIFIWVTLAMVVLAFFDFIFQRWQFEKDLRMTKQEVKEEHKQTEGDPQVKARIKSIQFQTARRRMMQQIPEADVVVTNPTHLALAIGYAPESMGAPQVVAKGAGRVAERIKAVALDHGIAVVENRELAQNLYKLVSIGEQIPVQLYQAVAELLAYVYKLKGKTAG